MGLITQHEHQPISKNFESLIQIAGKKALQYQTKRKQSGVMTAARRGDTRVTRGFGHGEIKINDNQNVVSVSSRYLRWA